MWTSSVKFLLGIMSRLQSTAIFPWREGGIYMKQLLVVLLLLSVNVFAGQQKLLDISSDIDSETAKFYVQTDSNHDVTGLVYTSYQGEKKLETKSVSVDQAENGVVLNRTKGRDIVKLTATNFSSANGGIAKITYLFNGATGRYGSMEIDLRRDGDTWSVYYQGKKIRGLKFLGKKVAFLGLVGIRTIRTY